MPGCGQTSDFAFSGESTLARLGLRHPGGDQKELHQRGWVWVTRDRVDFGGERTRYACIEWLDGSGGMGFNVPDDWQPPAPASETLTNGASPIALLVLLTGVIVIGGVSLLAFREKRVEAE